MQRKLFQEYERRENTRKVRPLVAAWECRIQHCCGRWAPQPPSPPTCAPPLQVKELLAVCPDLSESAAERALKLCHGRFVVGLWV